MITAVHNAGFETNPSFDFRHHSTADLYLRNYFTNSMQRDKSFINEDSYKLTDLLEVGTFFNDGDFGVLDAHLGVFASNYEYPVPGALWLLSSGLPFLLVIKRRGRYHRHRNHLKVGGSVVFFGKM